MIDKAGTLIKNKQKYKIEGSLCPSCAAKVEGAWNATAEIGETTINMVNKTVYLPPSALALAQEIMEKIEPGTRLVPADAVPPADRGGQINPLCEGCVKYRIKGKNYIQIAKISLATVLLVIGLLFQSRWNNTSMELMEYLVFLIAYILVGYPVLYKAAVNIVRGAVFDENFLMALATIGAILIHQLPEAVGVMLFYSVGESVEERAVNRSRRSIQALLDVRPDYANVIKQLVERRMDPEEVQVGDQIIVRPGEKIPLDGEIVHGSSFVDTSALTGESVPRKVGAGETVLAGMINTSGVLIIRVLRPFAESSVQKILDLVENAGARKARTEKFITTFARYYTPTVVVIALGIAFIPPLFMGGALKEWLYRAMTILVISCPCALVISVPLGYFGGIGGASRHGILVKGANFLEALTKVDMVVFDKTGTLTQGVFDVVTILPSDAFSQEALLEITAQAEAHSSHPIARSIRERYGREIDQKAIEEYQEVSGQGIKAKIRGQEVLVGKASFIQKAGISIDEGVSESQAGTIVHVAVDGKYAGYLVIADRIKEGAKSTLTRLNRLGIKTVMLTGDHGAVAQAVAAELGISEYYADLLPEDKVIILEKLKERQQKDGKIVFVGDGINDAPVLTRADIGVAMGGLGSDAAIEAADVVLMEDQPGKLLTVLAIARYTKKIIWQNILFALLIKGGFILMGMFGVANMWEAVFGDVGVALLAILNATRVRGFTLPRDDYEETIPSSSMESRDKIAAK